MAHGVSSLAILSSPSCQARVALISIDPNQHIQWHATGVSNVVRAGFSQAHELLEIPDYLGLPRLLEQNTIVDFAYVDGWHTFDYTMLDFFYLDKLLKVGGIVGFNDCGWSWPWTRCFGSFAPIVTTRKWMLGLDPTMAPVPTTRSALLDAACAIAQPLIVISEKWRTGSLPGISTRTSKEETMQLVRYAVLSRLRSPLPAPGAVGRSASCVEQSYAGDHGR